MKKIIICGCIAMMLFGFSGCESGDIDVSEESVYSDESSYVDEFQSFDELAEFIISDKDGKFKPLFESSSDRSDSSKLTVYKFKNIPDNYDLQKISCHGNFISMNYISEETEMYEKAEKERLDSMMDIRSDVSKKESYYMESSSYIESSDEGSEYDSETSPIDANMGIISFVWGYNTEGDEYLKNAVNSFGLSEMSDMPGFYYSMAQDDRGVLIYQIYWSEDGYCFQLNIPSEIFDKLRSVDFMELEKKEYDVPLD